MACKLYIKYYGTDIRAGSFRSKEAAEAYYSTFKESFRQKDGTYGKPIYVKTGKGRGKK